MHANRLLPVLIALAACALSGGAWAGRPLMPQEGKICTGEELMRDGMVPSCAHAMEASVIELRP